MKKKIISLYLLSLIIHLVLAPFMQISYDEAAYSYTAMTLVRDGSWFDLYGSKDLFFFPPLFNYFSGILVAFGLDRLYAVRAVTLIFSSGIAPILYLLMKQSHATEKESLLSSLLWLFLPVGSYYSIIGQVETCMIFFLLASTYFLIKSIQSEQIKPLLFSAVLLSASVWIKETSFGLFPVYLLLIYLFKRNSSKKTLIVWSTVFFILISPLIIQTLVPHKYDLFYEITTPKILWNNFNPDMFFTNLTRLNGLFPGTYKGFYYFYYFLILLTILFSIIKSIKSEIIYNPFMIFSLCSLFILIPFFIVFPKKFLYYLLPVYIFIIPFLARFLLRYRYYALCYLTLLIIPSVQTYKLYGNTFSEKELSKALNYIASQPGSNDVGMTLPRVAEYIAQRDAISVNIIDLMSQIKYSRNKGYVGARKTMLKKTWILGSDYFLYSMFCRKWPLSEENCDKNDFDTTMSHFTLEKTFGHGSYKLYRNTRAKTSDKTQ